MECNVCTLDLGVTLVFVVVALFTTLITALLVVVPFWKICTKAGFPGPLSLLMLVPIANIVLPFYIAFAPWPVLEDTTPREEYPEA